MNKTIVLMLLSLVLNNAAIAACNSQMTATSPTSRFIISSDDGTATDSQTGLMWKRCPESFTFSNNSTPAIMGDDSCIVGTTTQYSWSQVLKNADALNTNTGYADYNDWRIPNIKELTSIIEHACTIPAINETVFPNNPKNWHSDQFASSSHNGATTNTRVLYVEFYYGRMRISINDSYYSRLVRNVLPVN